MEIPDLVRNALGDEAVTAGVNLGDEDAVCRTPTRALLYRGEGLLSDESVEEFPLDVERLRLSEGRRKTKFVLEYVDRKAEFTVPGKRADRVLELLMEGLLRATDVIESAESVAGVYRFSELTLVVTDNRMLKHVGAPVWDPDFEEFPYEELTRLDFEEGSVATQLVLIAGGRPERIKAPNEQAPMLRQALERVVFDYYDVDSLEALNERIGDEDANRSRDAGAAASDITLESGIDPLVSEDGDDAGADEAAPAADGDAGRSASDDAAVEPAATASDTTTTADADVGASAASETGAATTSAADPPETTAPQADVDALEAEVAELRETVERQNAILKQQHETLRQLIEELRQGRGG